MICASLYRLKLYSSGFCGLAHSQSFWQISSHKKKNPTRNQPTMYCNSGITVNNLCIKKTCKHNNIMHCIGSLDTHVKILLQLSPVSAFCALYEGFPSILYNEYLMSFVTKNLLIKLKIYNVIDKTFSTCIGCMAALQISNV